MIRIATAMLLVSLACGQVQAQAPRQSFEISADAAPKALREFGRQAGIQLLFDYKALDGLKTRALTGTYEVEDALRRLLEGTGLSFGRVNERTLAIHSAAAPAPEGSRPTPPAATSSMSQEAALQPSMHLAQADANPPAESAPARTRRKVAEENREDVMVVTGTNIRGGAGPVGQQVEVLTREDIVLSGVNTMDELRDLLTQNFGGGGSDPGTFNTGQIVSATRDSNDFSWGSSFNLRGLGTSSTLTLLNGRRAAPAGSGDALGISGIPLNLVERIEVVTDGGSAVYGSDAVGGVVNIVTRSDFEGMELTGQYGATTDGPRVERGLNAIAGTRWDSGNAFLYGDYSDATQLVTADRDYTSALLDPSTTLLPDEERKGVYGAVKQDLGSRMRVSLDGLWSETNMRFALDPSTLDGEPGMVDVLSRAAHLSLGADYDLPGGWTAMGHVDRSTVEGVSTTNSLIISGEPRSVTNNASTTYELSASGPLFQLPGGPVRAAFGGLLRQQKFDSVTSEILLERDVTGAYGEFLVPVTSKLLLNLAARMDDYSNAGSQVTPKYGLSWEVAEGLKFRASFAEAFRAPALIQQRDFQTLIFQGARWTGRRPGDIDPRLPSNQSYMAIFQRAGNPDLVPESAEIITAGFDLQPAALPGLRVGVTYFDIAYSDVIFFVFPFLRVNDPAFSSLVTPEPGAALLQQLIAQAELVSNRTSFAIDLPAVQVLMDSGVHNVANLNTSGFDINARYGMSLGEGKLSLSLKASYVLDYILKGTPIAPPVNNIDRVGDPLRLTVRSSAAYSRGGWTATAAMVFNNAYVDDVFSVDPEAPVPIDSLTTFDLGLHYDTAGARVPAWLEDTRLSLTVRNAGNRKPPYVQDWFGFNYDSAHGDPVGRFVTFQLTRGWGR